MTFCITFQIPILLTKITYCFLARGSRGDPQTALDIQNDTLVSKHKGILQQKSVEDAGTSVGKKYRTVEENSSPIEPDKRVPENSRKGDYKGRWLILIM